MGMQPAKPCMGTRDFMVQTINGFTQPKQHSHSTPPLKVIIEEMLMEEWRAALHISL